jgi:hypothetical protein
MDRRDFLIGAAAFPLSAAIPSFASQASPTVRTGMTAIHIEGEGITYVAEMVGGQWRRIKDGALISDIDAYMKRMLDVSSRGEM